MAKKKYNKLQTKWIILLGALLLFLVGFSLLENNAKNGSISKEEAITKIKTLPKVKDYLERVPTSLILVNGEENNAYLIQVYEVKNGHTATFNWYKVDKTTGEVEKEF